MLDRFYMMTAWLAGMPAPPPPTLIGRRHHCRDDDDAPDDLAGLSAAEVASRIGCSRQAASLRIAAANRTGDWSRLLAPKATFSGRVRR